MMQTKGIQMVDEMTYLVALADPVVWLNLSLSVGMDVLLSLLGSVTNATDVYLWACKGMRWEIDVKRAGGGNGEGWLGEKRGAVENKGTLPDLNALILPDSYK